MSASQTDPSLLDLALDDRSIGDLGSGDGPTVVLFGGIHGNEPAGVLAIEQVFKALRDKTVRGRVIGIKGNLQALAGQVRMIDVDLNRTWTAEQVELAMAGDPMSHLGAEAVEFVALARAIHTILELPGAKYFIDLHTTSGPTVPFITLNDTLLNRAFINGLHVPVVMGIEEYLEGPILSYLMERGHVSMAFESGQHTDPHAVEHHERFIWTALHRAGCIELLPETLSQMQHALLPEPELRNALFDIRSVQLLGPDQDFRMELGHRSFERVPKQRVIAHLNGRPISFDRPIHLFMPLYQPQGTEGFFVIRRVSWFWMKLSALLRKTPLHHTLHWLPGVSRVQGSTNRILVDTHIARKRVRDVFHLLGYRMERKEHGKLRFIRRDRQRPQ